MADYSNKKAGNYTITRKLGDGGFATVYLAQHTVLEKKAAVKFLLEDWIDDADVVARFFDEARTMERLHDHPSIVKIIDIATFEKCKEEGLPPYFIMEYIDGRSLEDLIKSSEGFTLDDIVKIMVCALSALQHCHDQGVVHRDIKPSNFMINSSGDVKLTDFGIAKACKNTSKTGEGLTLGSTDYMSPEQALGKRDLDYRSDIYSLGVTLYQLVCDRLPFVGDSPNAIALKHIQEKPVPPIELNDAVPKRLNDIILKAMQKDREHRFQSCDEMLQALIKLNEPGEDVELVSEVSAIDLTAARPEADDDAFSQDYDHATGSTTRKFAARPPVELINAIRTGLIFVGFTILFLLVFKGYYHFTQAHLKFETYPPGAFVTLNKDLIGSSPVDISLPPMGYLISFSLPGFATATFYYDVVARQHLDLNIKMLELSPKSLGQFHEQMNQIAGLLRRLPEEPPKTKKDQAAYDELRAKIAQEWEALYKIYSEYADYEEFHSAFLKFCTQTSNLKKAEAFLSRLSQERPSAIVFTFAGLLKKQQNDRKEALRLFMEAWTKDANNRFLLNTLGEFFVEDQNQEKARQYYEMSLFLYPEQNEIRKRIAELK